MRKRLLALLLLIAAVLSLRMTASADPQLENITDRAGLLGDSERQQLEEMAESVSERYGVGVYIVTVDDYLVYSFDGVYEADYTIYHEYSMGVGEDRNGIMLLLSMEDRDYALFCYGEQSEYAFSSYGLEELEEVFLDNFGDDDWYGGFEDFISECSVYLGKAEEGNPVRLSPVMPIVYATGAALFIAWAVLRALRKRMKNVSLQTSANAYAVGKLVLTAQADTFTHQTVARRRIKSSSSGGSGRSGGGGSGRSGKF